jgi:hypothetical protein
MVKEEQTRRLLDPAIPCNTQGVSAETERRGVVWKLPPDAIAGVPATKPVLNCAAFHKKQQITLC